MSNHFRSFEFLLFAKPSLLSMPVDQRMLITMPPNYVYIYIYVYVWVYISLHMQTIITHLRQRTLNNGLEKKWFKLGGYSSLGLPDLDPVMCSPVGGLQSGGFTDLGLPDLDPVISSPAGGLQSGGLQSGGLQISGYKIWIPSCTHRLGVYRSPATRFGSRHALTCLEKVYRTLNCTSCSGNNFKSIQSKHT